MTETGDTGDVARRGLVTRLWGQQCCIDKELGCGTVKTRRADPEFEKNLLIFRRLLGEAAELCQRRSLRGTKLARLEMATKLPEPVAGPLKVLLARRFQLEQVLLELADRTYLTSRLCDLYNEGPGTYVTWKGIFGDTLPALLDPDKAASHHGQEPSSAVPVVDHEVERTRLQLQRLLHEKESQDQVMRARQELINRAVPKTICVVGLMAAAFAATSYWVLVHNGPLIVLALVSGGTGAALGGLIKLRDQVQWGTQARRFWLAFVAQVLIGSIAGMLAFLVYPAGAVTVAGGEAGVAVLALALGFSEAAFISLLNRFANPKTT